MKNIFKKEKDRNILDIRTRGQNTVFIIVFILFSLYALSLIVPFIWLFMSSLKKPFEFIRSDVFALPEQPQFVNFITAFKELKYKKVGFFQMVFNSLWMTIGSNLIYLICSSMTSYCIAKYKFKGRNFLYALTIFLMVFPISGSLAADVKLRINLNIYDSPLQLVVCAGGFGSAFLILYAFFQGVSWHYAEAAMIDGASHDFVFWKIMMPQVMPAFLTLFITSFIGGWNDYMTSIVYYPSFPTLAAGLYLYESSMESQSNYPVYFAGLFISMIPIFAIFIAFQDTIMTSVSIGGLKG